MQVLEYNCTRFKCLGGFKNVRHVYHWNDHKIELDETQVRSVGRLRCLIGNWKA